MRSGQGGSSTVWLVVNGIPAMLVGSQKNYLLPLLLKYMVEMLLSVVQTYAVNKGTVVK
jgi:hypothetical protein